MSDETIDVLVQERLAEAPDGRAVQYFTEQGAGAITTALERLRVFTSKAGRQGLITRPIARDMVDRIEKAEASDRLSALRNQMVHGAFVKGAKDAFIRSPEQNRHREIWAMLGDEPLDVPELLYRNVEQFRENGQRC